MPTRRSTGTPAGAGSIRQAPGLERARRQLREVDETVPSPPSSLDPNRRTASAARSGRQELQRIAARASRNQSRTDGRRRRRRLGRCLFGRRRGAWRRQPDSRSGSRRRHRQGARRRVPGQRAAQGFRQNRRARSSSLGARSGVVGGLSGSRLIRQHRRVSAEL